MTRPDDNFVDTTDTQAVLLGQFNKLYGKTGAAPIAPPIAVASASSSSSRPSIPPPVPTPKRPHRRGPP